MMGRKFGDAEEPVTPPTATPTAPPIREGASIRWSLEDALDAGVLAALERMFGSYEGDLSGVQRVLRLEFQAMLRTSGRSIRSLLRRSFLTELHRSHIELVLAREHAKEELARLETRRAEFGTAPPAAAESSDDAARSAALQALRGPEVDRAGLEERFRQVLARAPLSPEENRALAADLGKEALSVLEEALESFRLRRDRATQEEIDRYERRITKLKESLARTEHLLSGLASTRRVDAGVASIYRTVQGLQDDAAQHEKKAALLADIFEANLALRTEIEGLGTGLR